MPSPSDKSAPDLPDLVAHVVSYAVSPILVPCATTLVLLLLIGADPGQMLAALVYVGLAFSVIPLADILWMVSRGFATSLDLPVRSQRTEPLSLVILCGLGGLFLYSSLQSSIDLVSVLALTFVANTVVVLVINLFWKISVHAIAVGGMLGIVLYLVGPAFGLTPPFEAWLVATLVVLVPLVMWARIQLRMHTPAQVIAGAVLGVAGHWAGFYWMTRVWF